MHLVNHHPFEPRKNALRVAIAGQKRQAFRRSQQDLRRVRALATLLRGAGVAGTILDANIQAHLLGWPAQITFDICRQSFEGRDIERVQASMGGLRQISKARQEPRQGFAAAGRSDQQASGIAARLHDLQLMRMGLPAFLGEPVSEGGRQNIRHAPI